MIRSCHTAPWTLRKGSCWGVSDLIRRVRKRDWALPEKRLEVGEGPDVGALFWTLKVEGNAW